MNRDEPILPANLRVPPIVRRVAVVLALALVAMTLGMLTAVVVGRVATRSRATLTRSTPRSPRERSRDAAARVSRLMGHANEAITGAIYTHEIERRDNPERTRAKMREAFGLGGVAEAEVVELAAVV